MTKQQQPIPINPIQDANGQLMVMAAHRYSLGRRNYMASTCTEWLTHNWGMFTPDTQRTIITDTARAIMDGEAGMTIDVATWQSFGEWAYARLSVFEQERIQRSLLYMQKPFPFGNKPTN